MKRYARRYILLSALLPTCLGGGSSSADTWRGTAPFCKGQCEPGEVEIRRSKSGNGGQCWSGTKALCRNTSPSCEATQTKAKCYGVVQICDNGYYSIPDVWNSCATYACGVCLGFDF